MSEETTTVIDEAFLSIKATDGQIDVLINGHAYEIAYLLSGAVAATCKNIGLPLQSFLEFSLENVDDIDASIGESVGDEVNA